MSGPLTIKSFSFVWCCDKRKYTGAPFRESIPILLLKAVCPGKHLLTAESLSFFNYCLLLWFYSNTSLVFKLSLESVRTHISLSKDSLGSHLSQMRLWIPASLGLRDSPIAIIGYRQFWRNSPGPLKCKMCISLLSWRPERLGDKTKSLPSPFHSVPNRL